MLLSHKIMSCLTAAPPFCPCYAVSGSWNRMLASHVNLTESCQAETMCLLEGPVGNPGCIFLIGDCYEWTQLTVGEAIAGLVALEALRTQAE